MSAFAIGQVGTVDTTPRLVAVVRQQVGYMEMGDAQRRGRSLLDAALRAAGLVQDGPRLTVWRPLDGGLVDYAPGVFIQRPIPETAEVSLLTLPAGRAAHLTLTGSFAGLPAAWEALFAECAGHARAGLNWEVYTAAGPDGDTTDLYTLLA